MCERGRCKSRLKATDEVQLMAELYGPPGKTQGIAMEFLEGFGVGFSTCVVLFAIFVRVFVSSLVRALPKELSRRDALHHYHR